MTVGSNNIVTYSDLVNSAIVKIKALCHNIDSFSTHVPNQYKTGYTVVKARKYFPETKGGEHGGIKIWRTGHTSYIRAITNDAHLVVVSSATVENDINNFMTSRGMKAKSDTVMSFKAIINFFNNLSAFISIKTFYVYSPVQGTQGIVFYNKDSVTYPTVSMPTYTPAYTGDTVTYNKPVEPFDINNPEYIEVSVAEVQAPTDEQVTFASSQLQTSVSEFMSSMNNVSNIHQALITLSYACCSCSSSSSSSSSSCSSSSSSFIAYMDI